MFRNARRLPETNASNYSCFKTAERICRVLIDDMRGEISDSKTGWKDPEDKEAARKWAQPVSLVCF